MSFNLFGIAGKRVAVAVHDGQFWHVRIFTHAKGDWRLKAEQRFPGTNPQEVPEEALAFASDHDAGRLRVLTTGRVFAIEAALPEDSDFEEMHTALAYETGRGNRYRAFQLTVGGSAGGHFSHGRRGRQDSCRRVQ